VIEQHPELWPPDGDRPRQWVASVMGPGDPVIVRYVAILEPGEELTEYPKTLELTADEWRDTHADYGLNVDGSRIEEG
jgi:hypothetical protein